MERTSEPTPHPTGQKPRQLAKPCHERSEFDDCPPNHSNHDEDGDAFASSEFDSGHSKLSAELVLYSRTEVCPEPPRKLLALLEDEALNIGVINNDRQRGYVAE